MIDLESIAGRRLQPPEPPLRPSLPPRPPGFEIAAYWPTFEVAKVVVMGDVDASNEADILDYALSKALLCRELILDLTRVRFFACSCCSMLATLRLRCARAGVALKVLNGSAVARALDIHGRAQRLAA
jgi:anti-anti-sigma factor